MNHFPLSHSFNQLIKYLVVHPFSSLYLWSVNELEYRNRQFHIEWCKIRWIEREDSLLSHYFGCAQQWNDHGVCSFLFSIFVKSDLQSMPIFYTLKDLLLSNLLAPPSTKIAHHPQIDSISFSGLNEGIHLSTLEQCPYYLSTLDSFILRISLFQ